MFFAAPRAAKSDVTPAANVCRGHRVMRPKVEKRICRKSPFLWYNSQDLGYTELANNEFELDEDAFAKTRLSYK